MVKNKQIIPLSSREEQRLYEIKFYLIIRHLATTLPNAQDVYEYLETMCHICRSNTSVIKSCAALFQEGSRARVVPGKAELGVTLYRCGMTLSAIRALTKIHPQTLYTYLEQFNKDEFEYMPKFNDSQRNEIIKFVTLYSSLCITL